MKNLLKWKDRGNYQEAQLGSMDDGVSFILCHQPTCYRRGPFKLMVTVCSGENHVKWGCFDDQDQPERYYHKEKTAKSEAEEIANVLQKDRLQFGKIKQGSSRKGCWSCQNRDVNVLSYGYGLFVLTPENTYVQFEHPDLQSISCVNLCIPCILEMIPFLNIVGDGVRKLVKRENTQ